MRLLKSVVNVYVATLISCTVFNIGASLHNILEHICPSILSNKTVGPKINPLLGFNYDLEEMSLISLVRRLQAQTISDATPSTGKINPFNKIALTFEPVM